MATKNNRESLAKEIAKHHTSLVLFEAAAQIIESSDIDADYYVAAQKIARLCRVAEQRCLRKYDAAMLKLSVAP